ncbi:MAG TPA: hypothetical protein VGS12_12005 [Caulobacteraceae bacterium]|nr:hypothetical protein [Caulobacteraceae bacterium]
MDEDRDEDRVVTVSASVRGTADPRFVINYKGVYYVTLAVAEYDRRKATEWGVGVEGCEQVAELFKASPGHFDAAEISSNVTIACCATRPLDPTKPPPPPKGSSGVRTG